MGPKCRNWKARRVISEDQVHIDKSEESKIQLDLVGVKESEYDDCNALVLPSKKRKTKVQTSDVPNKKRLTKKQRRLLEKVIERKDKKAKRADLLSSLEKVQVAADELSRFTSISQMQSHGIKELSVDTGGSPAVRVEPSSRGWRKSGKEVKRSGAREESDSDESSIHTSDMSSDEDDAAEDTADKNKTPHGEIIDPVVAESSVAMDTDEKNSSSALDKSNKTDNVKDVSIVTAKNLDRKSAPIQAKKFVLVERKKEIEDQRSKLPVVMEEQLIMEKISENPVVIVCGETGSGKTTQIPQFLYEAGYAGNGGMIGVTQPRRVAAICMSKRVAEELNLSPVEVSYQIRYEGNTSEDTKIKFMTDGVLLKEVQNDFLLTKYSVIILDEAHERSVYTDILIGLLSRIVPLRLKRGSPLKLIIMSATLRVTDFTENRNLFKQIPPVIQVESRQFPVTVHFNKRTFDDYLEEAFNKVCKIHKKLPEGSILVFVTSQQEVLTLCRRLKQTFKSSSDKNLKSDVTPKLSKKKKKLKAKQAQELLPKIDLDNYSAFPDDEEDDTTNNKNEADEESDSSLNLEDQDDDDCMDKINLRSDSQPMHILPMFSLLSAEKQAKVFLGAPEGSRLCVVSTNVSETSLTIPGIKYVVDTGKEKTKVYDKLTGVSTFEVTWISQASANQRTGRAGRTGPGHSYRLYSSAVFNNFEKHTQPEICRRPVDDLILQMKDMGIDHVINFPFPSPPDVTALEAAEKLLVSLGALTPQRLNSSNNNNKTSSERTCNKITPLGRTMSQFPVSPRYAKMLSCSNEHGILTYVIALVSALSVQELFIDNSATPDQQEDGDTKEDRKQSKQKFSQIRKKWSGVGNSLLLGDMMVLLKAVGACEYDGCTPEFCEAHGLRFKAMVEVRKLRKHLTNTANLVFPGCGALMQPDMKPPTEQQISLIRQVVLMGLADHVARKVFVASSCDAEEKKKLNFAYQDMSLEDLVYIHPSSVLYKTKHEYIVYQSLEETAKLYMKGIAVVEADWLPIYAASHCNFSTPQAEDPSTTYDSESGSVKCCVKCKFGPQQWELPEAEVTYPRNGDCLRWFAKFLLEGEVISDLKPFLETLLLLPSTLMKKWAHLQPKTTRFLEALASESVYNRTDLVKVWKKNPQYLLKEIKEWIPESVHDKLTASWPSIVSSR